MWFYRSSWRAKSFPNDSQGFARKPGLWNWRTLPFGMITLKCFCLQETFAVFTRDTSTLGKLLPALKVHRNWLIKRLQWVLKQISPGFGNLVFLSNSPSSVKLNTWVTSVRLITITWTKHFTFLLRVIILGPRYVLCSYHTAWCIYLCFLMFFTVFFLYLTIVRMIKWDEMKWGSSAAAVLSWYK